MMASGRLDVAPLISHRFALTEAPKAYDVIREEPNALGVMLSHPAEARREQVVEVAPGVSAGTGDRPRVAVLEVSAERLLCATPPSEGLIGDVHLLLSNNDVVYIDTGLDYTYYVQPTVFSSVSPEGGPKRGGTRVTLTGAGFAAFVSESQPLSRCAPFASTTLIRNVSP